MTTKRARFHYVNIKVVANKRGCALNVECGGKKPREHSWELV
jgi:hypothetical protein